MGVFVVCILFVKKKKKAQAGIEWSNILPKSSQARKEPPYYVCEVFKYIINEVMALLSLAASFC